MQSHMRKQVNKAVNIYYRKSQPALSSVSIEILTNSAPRVTFRNCIIIIMQ
jgi:hypothetical protein